MRYIPFKLFVTVMALAVGVGCGGGVTPTTQTPRNNNDNNNYAGMSTTPTQEDLGNLAWASGPSGEGLPPGKGTAKDAMPIYFAKCVMCHGANLEGVAWGHGNFSPFTGSRLGEGNGVPVFHPPADRVSTLAYQVPWATVIFNTIAVEMPFLHPGTLKVDEVYSLTALVLFKNGLIKEDDVMDRTTLPKVQMPNRNAYPASDEIYMDMKKRGCIEKYGICRDP
jgi:hypothetical protein